MMVIWKITSSFKFFHFFFEFPPRFFVTRELDEINTFELGFDAILDLNKKGWDTDVGRFETEVGRVEAEVGRVETAVRRVETAVRRVETAVRLVNRDRKEEGCCRMILSIADDFFFSK